MTSEETVTFNLELNVAEVASESRKLELVLYRVTGLLHRLGLPEDINNAMMIIQKAIMTVRLMHSAVIALNAALIAVSGGSYALIQFALAGVALAGVGLSFSDMLSGY